MRLDIDQCDYAVVNGFIQIPQRGLQGRIAPESSGGGVFCQSVRGGPEVKIPLFGGGRLTEKIDNPLLFECFNLDKRYARSNQCEQVIQRMIVHVELSPSAP